MTGDGSEKGYLMEKDKKKAPLSAKTALSATMAATLAFTMAPVPQHRAFAEERGGGLRVNGV